MGGAQISQMGRVLRQVLASTGKEQDRRLSADYADYTDGEPAAQESQFVIRSRKEALEVRAISPLFSVSSVMKAIRVWASRPHAHSPFHRSVLRVGSFQVFSVPSVSRLPGSPAGCPRESSPRSDSRKQGPCHFGSRLSAFGCLGPERAVGFVTLWSGSCRVTGLAAGVWLRIRPAVAACRWLHVPSLHSYSRPTGTGS